MLNNHNTKALTFIGITAFVIVFSFVTSKSKYSQLYAGEYCNRERDVLISEGKISDEGEKAIKIQKQQNSNNPSQNDHNDIQVYENNKNTKNLNREILSNSLLIGTRFLLASQKAQGNFNCEYDFIDREYSYKDEQIKQALTLWGLTLMHRDNPTKETFAAIEKGLAFFDRHSLETKDGKKYIDYPGDGKGKTGTIALVALSLIEFLNAENPQKLSYKYEECLGKYMEFLISLRMDNGLFHKYYYLKDGSGYEESKPQVDGEVLLAMIKAIKHKHLLNLKDKILESAENMYRRYVKNLNTKIDSKTTEKFFPWGALAFYELYTSDWQETEKYANYLIDSAYWIIDVHGISKNKKNTAYALESLIPAWQAACKIKNKSAKNKIEYIIDQTLYKLTTWQMGSSLQNKFLEKYNTNDPHALGGIMNSQEDKLLRTNVTHHQMYAVIQARKYIYIK